MVDASDDGSSTDGRSSRGDRNAARRELLEESRKTLGEQLGQIEKIDDAAVRTVRISLVVSGIVAGGSRLTSVPEFGIAGYAGTFTLILSLVGAISVYGTSKVFLGSAPDSIAVQYTETPIVENTYVEILSEYDDGISDNRSTLHANGFILSASRALLVLSVVLLVYAFTTGGSATPPTAGGAQARTLIPLQAKSATEMSETQTTDRDRGQSADFGLHRPQAPRRRESRSGRVARETGSVSPVNDSYRRRVCGSI